jgi:prephenate dehydrogenase
VRIAIIGGSGKMGQWFADFLLKDGKEVVLIGRNEKRLLKAKQQLGVDIATDPAAVNGADAVLISVPIDSFGEVVKQLSPHTQSEQVIMDITSIKASPVEIMHRYIKRGVVLGTHPMFGPGATTILNHNFILTPTSEEEKALAQKIRQYLETRGARVSLMNPNEHDEMVSVILGLSHFIALVSADTLLNLDKSKEMRKISGVTFKLLLTLVESVISQNPELYASLQMNLPNMTHLEKLFQRNVKTWADLVESKDKQGILNRMKILENKLRKTAPDYKNSYTNMYKIVQGL